MSEVGVEVETKIIYIEGVQLIVPTSYTTRYNTLKSFPDCCGAGDGFGERVIPESILGLRISAACHIHDHDFEVSPPTWAGFHAASNRFVTNIYSIIRDKSNFGMGYFRVLGAATYFYMVDTKGAFAFKLLKRKQGYTVT